MNYRYRAMTQDGQKLQGIIDANDERQVILPSNSGHAAK